MSTGKQPRRTRRFACAARFRATAGLIQRARRLLFLGAAGLSLAAGETRADAALRPVLTNAPNVVIEPGSVHTPRAAKRAPRRIAFTRSACAIRDWPARTDRCRAILDCATLRAAPSTSSLPAALEISRALCHIRA